METSKKWTASQNKQPSITNITAELDRETEELRHCRVTLEISKVIQWVGHSKGLTQNQREAASHRRLCSGQATPNNQDLAKLKEPQAQGKDIGKPIEGPKGK